MHKDVAYVRAILSEMADGVGPDPPHRRAIILAEQGCGDTARAICLCGALHEAAPDTHITLVGHYDGRLMKRDMAWCAHQAGVVDAYIEAWPVQHAGRDKPSRMHRGDLLAALRGHCDVLYDAMGVAVGEHHRDDLAAQHAADRRLAPYRILYDGYPEENWRLKGAERPWAGFMAETTGLPVDIRDLALAAALECAPPPDDGEVPPWDTLDDLVARSGSADVEAAAVTPGLPYVVIHAGAGARSNNKVMPKAVADAIIRALESKGFPCCSVGNPGDLALPTAWKRMGLRLPVVNRLIQNAICLVDNEGFLPHMASGLGIPAAVLFSITPGEVYGLPGNKNILPGLALWTAKDALRPELKGMPRRCPAGTCFWGGGWTYADGSGESCRLGLAACCNWPRPEEAAECVTAFVTEVYGKKRKEQAA